MLTTERSVSGIGDGFTLLRAWRAERLSLLQFAPLALLIASAACLGSKAGAMQLFVNAIVALMLLTQFRLWDDLVDANRDRSLHPQRVLAASGDRRVFVAACIVLAVSNACALHALAGITTVTGFVILNALLAAWYAGHSMRGIVHLHVLLLKYPAFVGLLGAPAWTRSTLAGATAVYTAICLFDLRDRTALRTGVLNGLYALHGLALVVLAVLPKVDAFGVSSGAVVAVLMAYAWPGRSRYVTVGVIRAHAPFVALLVILVRHFLGELA